MLCGLGSLFMVSSLVYDFSVIGFYYPSLMLFFFFPCFSCYKYAELISWSFGPFYPELCGSSFSWVFCLLLFSFWGVSYLLASGCASGALGMYLPGSWWLWPSDYYALSGLLSWFFALMLNRDSQYLGDCFVSDLSFYPFLISTCFGQGTSWWNEVS